MFPFANPPYAARAYSYVSVAQYEALKVAWYYKYLYNRPSPARVDCGVRALVPATDLPAYPSEDAVMSGVTAEMLKLLFPASVEEITLKAAEQRQAALLSGKATASDLAAGLALGQAVAAVFVARAGADGMRTAGGSPALWQALADGAPRRAGRSRGGAMDNPGAPADAAGLRRRPRLDDDAGRLRHERPGAAAVDLVGADGARSGRGAAVRRQRHPRRARDRQQLGRWPRHAHAARPLELHRRPYIRKAGISEVRAARAFALLNMAMHDAAVGCWETKYFYFNPRPSQLDPDLKTTIGLPNFPSYTSGHSTFSAAAAEVLSYLFPAVRRNSRHRRKKRRSPGSTAGSTIAPTSRWARSTASGSAATPSASPAPTARGELRSARLL